MALVGAIFAVVGGALLLVYVVGAAGNQRFLRTAVDAEGVVVDNRAYFTNTESAGHHRYQPVVAFRAADGATHQFEDAVGTNTPPYPVGTALAVKYDPANPDDARIATSFRLTGGNTVFGLFGGVFFALGAVCLLIGLL